MEKSFGLLKPDCLKRGIEKEVLAAVESSGLKIIAMKRIRLTRKNVDTIWLHCREAKFYEDMVDFLASGDCIVFIVEGKNAISRLRNWMGYYEPSKAKEGTIRHLFGTSAMENVIHGSSDEEAYKKEKALFFNTGDKYT